MKNFDQLKNLLSSPKKIVIVTHPRPDGDAMGSSLGLYNYLRSKGHFPTVILPTEYPDYFRWMRGTRKAILYNRRKEDADAEINQADLVFCLDFNALKRVDPIHNVLEKLDVPFVLIDHHLEPELDEFQFALHSIKSSSTCELVADFIELMEGEWPNLNKDIVHCLYTGLVTDTGNFQNGATTTRSFELAAKFMKLGLDLEFIRENVFNTYKEKRIRFLGNALLNRLVVVQQLKIAYISVTKEDVRTYDLNAGDTEGLVNYPLTIKGIKVAVLLKEHGDIIKLSFRSKDDISVNDFARKYFQGGGHKNAAGGKSSKSLSATIIEITNLWKKEFA
ncbi:MAG: bifunctional oligoribonuclease/PAP phosphatase NrnA [Chitinophagales bacterium]